MSHSCFLEFIINNSLLYIAAMTCFLLCHGNDTIRRIRSDLIIPFKHIWMGQRAAELFCDLNDLLVALLLLLSWRTLLSATSWSAPAHVSL